MLDNDCSFLLGMFEFFTFFALLMCVSDPLQRRSRRLLQDTFGSSSSLRPICGMLIYLIAPGAALLARFRIRAGDAMAQVESAQAAVAIQSGANSRVLTRTAHLDP